ncbi:MAG: glycoside hydrolase family 3 protein, partial [Bacteroidales bacterium]|nr:glycoside hydrolase family 3 protein [Bacteroidales bacterium]
MDYFASYAQDRSDALWKNQNAPIAERVEDLLSRMTAEEKIRILVATALPIDRLGIPKYYHGNEALHGIIRPGRFTVFPQAIGMASMWDPDLVWQIANAASDEARARWNELGNGEFQTQHFTDLLTFWSPTVNMARDPRWGRTPETYGEDPYLTGVLGASFVKGLQGDDPKYLKVVSTPKHFACNNEEHNRFECNAVISEKQLREYYLPAYEMCVKEGDCESVMASYTSINGMPSSCSHWLLTEVLRDDWGFDGYVVSDCGGVGLIRDGHKFVPTYEEAATVAIKAGLDLECG